MAKSEILSGENDQAAERRYIMAKRIAASKERM